MPKTCCVVYFYQVKQCNCITLPTVPYTTENHGSSSLGRFSRSKAFSGKTGLCTFYSITVIHCYIHLGDNERRTLRETSDASTGQ